MRGTGIEVVREDGVTKFMFGHATPLFDEDGKVRGTVAAYLDLTDRHRSETALREREAQLHSATQIAGMEIWSLRAADTWMFATERIGEWFGVPFDPAGKQGAQYFRKVHPEDAERVRESFYGAFRDRVPCIAEFRTMPRAGDIRWLLTQGEIVRLPNGEERLLGVMMDITERKRAEENLLHSNRQLEQFAFAASHDLQEPLRTINIYTEFLIREFAEQKSDRADLFARTIREGVTRMQRLIRDLLTFSKLTQEEVAQQLTRVDSMAALLEALQVCQPLIEECNAHISYDALPAVMGDELQLALLFQNLISNGIKYRRRDVTPHIHIGVRLDPNEQQLVFTVSDNGIGFEAIYAESIFRPFERLQRDRSAGTGLGLAICRRIVERLRGADLGGVRSG